MATLDHRSRAQELIQQADICIFDIDGTLLNSRDAVHYFAFLNAIREVFKVEANTDGIHMHGNTDIGILRAVATRAGIPQPALEPELSRLGTERDQREIEFQAFIKANNMAFWDEQGKSAAVYLSQLKTRRADLATGLGRDDDPDLADAGRRHRLDSVEQHGLVGHRHELLRARVGERPQAGAAASGEDQTLNRRPRACGGPR